jgi:hypothetical protein
MARINLFSVCLSSARAAFIHSKFQNNFPVGKYAVCHSLSAVYFKSDLEVSNETMHHPSLSQGSSADVNQSSGTTKAISCCAASRTSLGNSQSGIASKFNFLSLVVGVQHPAGLFPLHKNVSRMSSMGEKGIPQFLSKQRTKHPWNANNRTVVILWGVFPIFGDT